MNIFVTNSSPYICARDLDDKRLVKMVLETAQLLSNALPADRRPYRPTHLKHPCSLWVAAEQNHYDWTLSLFRELNAEYTMRFNREHKCSELVSLFKEFREAEVYSLPEWVFVKCVPAEFRELPTFEAYRQTLLKKWENDIKPPIWRLQEEGKPFWRTDVRCGVTKRVASDLWKQVLRGDK